MIDAPGPWGSGPFTLTEGYSSLEAEIAIISADPFTCVWLPTAMPRSDRVVLDAFPDHWNTERGPRLERVVFRNDLNPAQALDLVCDVEGELDIVTEVDPRDAARVEQSPHAHLVSVDAMRVLVGVINRDAAPFGDAKARRALNHAIDRKALIQQAFNGYAEPLASLAPPYAAGRPEGQKPYAHDPEKARSMLADAGWPAGRPLRFASPADLQPIAEVVVGQLSASLDIDVDLTLTEPDQLLAAQHQLVEKVLPLPFDVLLHAWFDLASDAPPAVLHREFLHSGGAFRAGPPIGEFESMVGHFAAQTEAEQLNAAAVDIDRYVYDEALAVFLCAPKALVAVNHDVSFTGHAATFELAECEVSPQHWSRR